jgi:protein TonB
MSAAALATQGPLWARLDEDDEQTLALWKAVLIALAAELALPLLLFGVDWSFLPWSEPPPVPVMSAELRELPPEPAPPPDVAPPQPPAPPRQLELPKPIEIEPPKPLPGEQPSKIELPKPEPKPKPKPPPKPKEPTPQLEPEAPPLPSVFRDIKPVRKVKPVYPPEAEAQHVEGRVKVRLSVDLAGNVTAAELLLAEPQGVFEQSVLTAVRQYKFKPDGTEYQADQEIIFKLD